MLTPYTAFRSPPEKNAVPAVAAPPALGVNTIPANTHFIRILPAMVRPGGSRLRSFSSVSAFDGYVGELRRLGYSVIFHTPTLAEISEVRA